MKKILRMAWIGWALVVFVESSFAFDLSPKGTRFDQDAVKAWAPTLLDRILSSLAENGLEKFKEPVHEEITHRAYECNYEGTTICGEPDAQFATPYVIAGVRWNDDPPFQLNPGQAQGTSCKVTYPDGRPTTIRFITQPSCWAELFLGAERQLSADQNKKFDLANQSALPLRSHFGDLQFIHSMASFDGEEPADTRTNILGWAEFTWGVVAGNYKLGTWLKDIKVGVVQRFFSKSGWRIQDFFALGDQSLRPYIADVAFGSLLHMVEDSFSAGHIARMEPTHGEYCPDKRHRAPGPILEFHTYGRQNSSNHRRTDTREAFFNNRLTPDVVDVARTLVEMRDAKAEWPEVKAYLECVYSLSPEVHKASAGGF